ncbi:unnamed protein product (macronuclear) [Paramecium tetraurelia]|uniref:Uncharacterized protein n=1 Tax=Paramecium tetraurelia TaxID=5888 RepID=A0BFR6_PARTE|nr:uncharacterized protein GSPATT00028418001 [Paramecium tetraurelia]CAK57383.1 unnamed protein product [Paramecium tetraurelia]|eukprot:XP_001424781.1 hypothetical protein (macronuclear) [Paramecium tetraurelia strain d4-2]
MNSKQQHMTVCPALLKGDDQPDDFPLRTQNANVPKMPIQKKIMLQPNNEILYERLNQEAQIFKQNNQMLKDYYDQEELRPCSFTPQTLNDGQEKRSLYQFLFDQQNHVLKIEQKLEQIKINEMERDLQHPYHPKTNEFQFQSRDESIPTYERLYNLNQKKQNEPKMQQSESTVDFKPVIQQKSSNIVRTQKVEDILYQDAQRRQQKQQEVQDKKNAPKVVTVNVKYTSNNSEKIVAQKFIREFETVIDWIFDQTGQERPSNVSFSIDYLKLGEILQRLDFLNLLQAKDSNERAVEYENLRLSEERALLCEIWTVLRGDELGGISKRNLCLFLLTLIGITDFKIKELPSAQNEELPNYQKSIQPQQHKIVTAHQPNDKPKLGTIDKDGNIIFTIEETKKIQRQFDILYRNRLGCEELKKTNWKDENPYKPQILPHSKQLACQYREKLLEETATLIDNQLIKVNIPENGQITHADLLVLQKKAVEYHKEQKKQEILQQQLDKCPFKPQLLNNNEERKSYSKKQDKHLQLYSLAKPANQKRDRTTEEIEYERQLEECTFQPGLQNKASQQQKQDNHYVNKDVDKTVQRMKQARQRREEVQGMLERGYKSNKSTQNQQQQVQANSQKKDSRSESQNQIKQASQLSRQKSMQSEDSQQTNTFQSQNFHMDESQPKEEQSIVRAGSQQDERIPLLFVDVNLGPSKTERIVVYDGDQSCDLAARFAQEHNLDEFMQEKLKELLDYQISGLLTKIDEEEGALSENDQ